MSKILIHTTTIIEANPIINFFNLNEEQKKIYKFRDERGSFKWRDFMRTGGFSTPS
jgi:adenine-specific DNA-methyltransferase